MIQPFFDYACNACYINMNKKLKFHLQAAQNKCITFCLKLNARSSIKTKDFEKISSLPLMKEHQNVLYVAYTIFLIRIVLTIFDEIYVPLETNGVYTLSSFIVL